MRIDELYSQNHICNSNINLASLDASELNGLQKHIESAFKQLHQDGSYNVQNILDYQQLIDGYSSVFKSALNKGILDNEIPAAMLYNLENNIQIFSGLKTHAQLLEASKQLLDENGKLKSFNKFSQDISKIRSNYNQNYLEAEYEFAVSSAQSVANWQNLNESDRYNLQYRTAEDDRVRDSHQQLANITLPASDPFWNQYYPPNGWRCRCVAVEVRKTKYDVSDSDKALELGETATTQIGKNGKNKLEMFRFNPGQKQQIFPEGHPYSKVKGAKTVIDKISK